MSRQVIPMSNFKWKIISKLPKSQNCLEIQTIKLSITNNNERKKEKGKGERKKEKRERKKKE